MVPVYISCIVGFPKKKRHRLLLSKYSVWSQVSKTSIILLYVNTYRAPIVSGGRLHDYVSIPLRRGVQVLYSVC